MKFGRLIEHPKRNTFKKNYAENKAGKLVPNYIILVILRKSNWSAA